MTRALIVLALLSSAIGGSAIWALFQPSPVPFIVPGATEIEVVTTGWGQRRITYHVPGPPYGWYFTLVDQLAAQRWTQPDPWNPATPRHTYNQVASLWFGYLWDQAVITPNNGDPQRASVTVRRRMIIPWWRFWPAAEVSKCQSVAYDSTPDT